MSEFAAAASSVLTTSDPVFPAAELAAMRARFSSLSGDFVYLDAPGGTQTPDEIGAAVAKVYLEASGNTGAPYATSRRLDTLVDEARAASARFFGCAPEEIIFGGNMTSLNFMLTRTLGRELKPGDEIVVTRLDHDGNVAPWLDLASDLGLVVRHADVHADTTLDLADLERQLGPRTRVVAFPWCANSTGTIVDARAVCDLARAAGALSWVDAVQYAAHEPMDVQAIGADLVACSAYKFCGPHLGIAYGRRELLESWRPYKARPVPMDVAGHRFETGTLPYELLGALLATYSYLDSLGGMARLAAWEHQLGERLLAGLPAGARLWGLPTMAGRVPVFLVNFPGVPSAMLSEELAKLGFGVWSHGSYYALGLHDRIGWGEALRIGLAHYNTLDEIDRFNAALAGLVAAHRPGVRRLTGGGAFVRAGDVPAEQTSSGATSRRLLDTSTGESTTGDPSTGDSSTGDSSTGDSPGLVRHMVQVPAGRQFDGTAAAGGELWFVIDGQGSVTIDGAAGPALHRDRGLRIPPGAAFSASADGQDLQLDIVSLPAAEAGQDAGPGQAVHSDLAECEVERTGDREFRVLFGPGRGCSVATQFVGEIPPSRAPEHSHPYDEVVLVLSGTGVAHIGGSQHPLEPGICLHLPPGLLHCLENPGPGTLRVLGVFHPADSPAAKLQGG
jgi:cysteine desulfurase family protein (TIGR01976 family)